MKMKFSTRTVFVLVTFVAVYFAMIGWTQTAARGFCARMSKNNSRVATRLLTDCDLMGRQDYCLTSEQADRSEVLAPTLADVILLRRQCVVKFLSGDSETYYDNRAEYTVRIFSADFLRSRQTISAAR